MKSHCTYIVKRFCKIVTIPNASYDAEKLSYIGGINNTATLESNLAISHETQHVVL